MAASDKTELLAMTFIDPLFKGITGLRGKWSKHMQCMDLSYIHILQLHTGASPDHTPLAPQVLL